MNQTDKQEVVQLMQSQIEEIHPSIKKEGPVFKMLSSIALSNLDLRITRLRQMPLLYSEHVSVSNRYMNYAFIESKNANDTRQKFNITPFDVQPLKKHVATLSFFKSFEGAKDNVDFTAEEIERLFSFLQYALDEVLIMGMIEKYNDDLDIVKEEFNKVIHHAPYYPTRAFSDVDISKYFKVNTDIFYFACELLIDFYLHSPTGELLTYDEFSKEENFIAQENMKFLIRTMQVDSDKVRYTKSMML